MSALGHKRTLPGGRLMSALPPKADMAELIARQKPPPSIEGEQQCSFLNAFWGWSDCRPKDSSNAPFKRGYVS
jgi:hypothetical protein